MLRHPARSFGAISSTVILGAIGLNVGFLQSGQHPAPLSGSPRVVEKTATVAPSAAVKPPLPAPRVVKTKPITVPAAPEERRAEPVGEPDAIAAVLTGQGSAEDLLVLEVQTELQSLGFYAGALDGVMGPQTAAAIEIFEREAGLAPRGQASDTLLARLRSFRPSVGVGEPANAERVAASQPAAADPRVRAVQRALAQIGYSPGAIDGLMGGETRDAIRAFEADRRLPLTGEVSDRLIKELEAFTGQPVV